LNFEVVLLEAVGTTTTGEQFLREKLLFGEVSEQQQPVYAGRFRKTPRGRGC
jgi:hypothetical protein